ncbi:MAG: hypothetical protein PHY52_01720 [Candidatus Pacebacteria bacterium]|nr:hypothetical protein [Candidatus Paceibacterota bacterium]
MTNKFSSKKFKKDFLFTGGSIIVIIICGVLIFLSLTFLVKNINLVLKPLSPEESTLHFDISEAERLFPQGQEN